MLTHSLRQRCTGRGPRVELRVPRGMLSVGLRCMAFPLVLDAVKLTGPSLCSRFIGWLLAALQPELYSDVDTGSSTISPKLVASYAKKLAETDLELVKSTLTRFMLLNDHQYCLIAMSRARSPPVPPSVRCAVSAATHTVDPSN